MTLSSADIVNRAIQFNGGFIDAKPVAGTPPNFDGTTFGLAAGTLYNGVVQTVGRQFGWDFSRNTAVLGYTGHAAPPDWQWEYGYPGSGLEVRQLMTETPSANNPVPQRWTVGWSSIGGTPTKVIWCDLAPTAHGPIAYISGQPPEGLWDSLFTEAVVRLLASELALAVPDRGGAAQVLTTEYEGFEKIGESREG